jgi:hypothetical protein
VRSTLRSVRLVAIVGAALAVAAMTALPAVAGSAVLKVTPTFVGAPGDGPHCNRPNPIADTWVCHVTVNATGSSSTPAHWSATSVSGHTSFSPSHGTVWPGHSTTVKITTHLCGGYFKFKFAGAQNTVTVVYTCG